MELRCTAARNGKFTNGVAAKINSYFTASYTNDQRQSVAAHELGHSVGLGHQSGNPSYCQTVPIMQPDTYTRYTVCGHFRPQPDDVNGIDSIYGAPGSAPALNPVEGPLPAASIVQHVDVSYAVGYHTLQELRRDAASVAVLEPTGAASVEDVQGIPTTVAMVRVVSTLAGAPLPGTVSLNQIGAAGDVGPTLVSPGNTYIAYLVPHTTASGAVGAGQFDSVGGPQGLFSFSSPEPPSDLSQQAFTSLYFGDTALPAHISLRDARQS